MELPQYTVQPNTARMVTPWVLKLLGLSVLFYAGVYFMASSINKVVPPYINLFLIAFLIVLIVSQLLLYHVRFARYKYEFYTNRIEFSGNTVITCLFSDIQKAELKQNLFDKAFNTGTIRLTKAFSIGPVSNPARIKSYTEQLLSYYSQTQQSLRLAQQRATFQRRTDETQQ